MRRKNGGEKKGEKKERESICANFEKSGAIVVHLFCFVLIAPRRVPANRPGRVAAQERVADAQGNRDIAFSLWCVPRSPARSLPLSLALFALALFFLAQVLGVVVVVICF
jgi:hypothetical protein